MFDRLFEYNINKKICVCYRLIKDEEKGYNFIDKNWNLISNE